MTRTAEFMRQDKPKGSVRYFIVCIYEGEDKIIKRFLWKLHRVIGEVQKMGKTLTAEKN